MGVASTNGGRGIDKRPVDNGWRPYLKNKTVQFLSDAGHVDHHMLLKKRALHILDNAF